MKRVGKSRTLNGCIYSWYQETMHNFLLMTPLQFRQHQNEVTPAGPVLFSTAFIEYDAGAQQWVGNVTAKLGSSFKDEDLAVVIEKTEQAAEDHIKDREDREKVEQSAAEKTADMFDHALSKIK